MKRWIHASIDEGYTNFISEEIPGAVEVFMNTFDEELNYDVVKDACEAFWDDYKKFPNPNSMESLNIDYDEDKGRFYKKYIEFARRCKELTESRLFNPSGYGKKDYFVLKMRDGLRSVDYNFPYGWKRMVRE